MMSRHEAIQEIKQLKARLYELETQLREQVADEALPDGPLALLTGHVGGEQVGFLLECITEVVPMAQTTPLPESPPWVSGLLDLRGNALPVIDIQARIKRAGRRPSINDFIVVCADMEPAVGLVVSSVSHVLQAMPEQLVAPPPDIPFAPYVTRAVRSVHGLVLLLSIECLVHSDLLGRFWYVLALRDAHRHREALSQAGVLRQGLSDRPPEARLSDERTTVAELLGAVQQLEEHLR